VRSSEPKEKAPVKQPARNTPERIRTSDLWFRSWISIFPALSFQPFRLTIFACFGCCLGLAAHCLPTGIAHQKQTKSFGLLLKRRKYGRRLLRSPVVSPQRKRTRRKRAPRCIIIAGPNGAGKTTFARVHPGIPAKVRKGRALCERRPDREWTF
jgi:hypothetical protein